MVLATYVWMIDLKGISTDEGIRVFIINGGQPFGHGAPRAEPTYGAVLATCAPYAYEPLYFLIQNTVMRVANTHAVTVFRAVNLGFLGLALAGALALSRAWPAGPRLFLLGFFAFNTYLFMHVLQVREYTLLVACCAWSAWYTLQLDAREVGRTRADLAWFTGYGALLAVGFYTSSWFVFPAIAQALFLVARHLRSGRTFRSALTLSGAVCLLLTLPYLSSHQEKINLGRWGDEKQGLWRQLSDGFHLVLSGHVAGHSWFTEGLFWLWLAVIAGVALLAARPPATPAGAALAGDSRRQTLLMIASSAVLVVFQIGYFLRVDNLSVWPRYFVVHYFFLSWLVALGFRHLWEWRDASPVGSVRRRALTLAVGGLAAVAAGSAVYQTRSYYRDPYFDSGQKAGSNWRVWGEALDRALRPGDAVLTYDFVNRATLAFTRPFPHRMLVWNDLETADFAAIRRVVYLEPVFFASQRTALAGRLAARGFTAMQVVPIPSADGLTPLDDQRILIFSRP